MSIVCNAFLEYAPCGIYIAFFWVVHFFHFWAGLFLPSHAMWCNCAIAEFLLYWQQSFVSERYTTCSNLKCFFFWFDSSNLQVIHALSCSFMVQNTISVIFIIKIWHLIEIELCFYAILLTKSIFYESKSIDSEQDEKKTKLFARGKASMKMTATIATTTNNNEWNENHFRK